MVNTRIKLWFLSRVDDHVSSYCHKPDLQPQYHHKQLNNAAALCEIYTENKLNTTDAFSKKIFADCLMDVNQHLIFMLI